MKRFLVCLLATATTAAVAVEASNSSGAVSANTRGGNSSNRRTSVSLIDATSAFSKSTESSYDHQVELYADGDSHKLTYHWNDIQGNTIEGRLIHSTNSIENAPSWLGFGIYDTFANPDPVTSTTPLMVGSDAVIGLVLSQSVKLWRLGGKQVTADETGVHPAEDQALLESSIKQHTHDDGRVTTDLSFKKTMENGMDVKVRHAGDNVFLWAMGPPGVNDMETHGVDHRGAFKLDLTKVKQAAESGQTGEEQEEKKEEEFENNDQETTDGGGDTTTDNPPPSTPSDEKNTSPVVTGKCQSMNPDYEKMVALTPNLNFFWTLHPESNLLNAMLEYQGEAWLGLGFSQNGKMVGSTAVIGTPGNNQVQKYKLLDKEKQSITPMQSQTLETPSITQEGGVTKLAFGKLLNEGSGSGEVVLTTKGLNTLLFAVGSGNDFDYHQHRGAFRLDLDSCSAVMAGGKSATGATHMGAWATHGTFAVLAWAIASPFAMTVAWFRTLVPSSWIYVHVFSNVVSFTFSLIAVIIAFASMSYQTHPSHFSEPHHWVGLVLIVAMTFQVMNGFLRPPVEKRDPYSSNAPNYQGGGAGGEGETQAFFKIPRTPREIWFASHRGTGIAMLGMGIYQIQSGLDLFARNFNVESMVTWYWVYVALFGSGLISLKLWIRYEEYKARRGMETLSASPNGSDPQDTDALPVQFETR